MAVTKAVREAKARLADIEAKRAALAATVAAAEAARKPFDAKVAAIRKRRARQPIVSNTGGSFWFGTLGSFRAETYGARAAAKDGTRPVPKAIADAISTGGIKVTGNGGVSLTLRGLQGRVRIPNKAAVAAHRRAVQAENRAARRFSEARQAAAAALRAVFDGATKVDVVAALLPDLVAETVAVAKLDAVPIPYNAKQQLSDLVGWEGSPLKKAQAHLAFALSGSTGPCPCPDCAADRQKVIREREEAARRAKLPTRMVKCSAHGRHRMPWELKNTYTDNVRGVDWPADLVGRWRDLPMAYCPKGDVVVLVTEYLAERAKEKAAAEKAAAKVAKLRSRAKPAGSVVIEAGDTVEFVCPSCGEVSISEAYDDEDDGGAGDIRVECGDCQMQPIASKVQVIERSKAA